MTPVSVLVVACLLTNCIAIADFHLAVLVLVWRRHELASLVLKQIASLNVEGLHISTLVVGSEREASEKLALGYGMMYLEEDNSPLGKKHNAGLRKIREISPDAVTIIGSDDLVNAQYFISLKKAFIEDRIHVWGLKDVYFFDLSSETLVYTAGYHTAYLEVSASVGLGRAYSRQVLEEIDWHLWDDERERGLDQSAVRRIIRKFPLISTISRSVSGKDAGILAVDVKTKGLEGGENIWSFEDIKKGSGKDRHLQELEIVDDPYGLVRAHMGNQVEADLRHLREVLVRKEPQAQAEEEL
mmetsp:Transcript_42548/g.166094  ORF Transcript_42548/g.166094 Transcript_42548/m.166094 type:complete len:299 (-) Transcript_42548:2067-2963(-)